jgi:hypothetical protein
VAQAVRTLPQRLRSASIAATDAAGVPWRGVRGGAAALRGSSP